MKKFDAAIIGSGQAGTPLAYKLASDGRKVAFIEKKHFGGTCVNDGCTPTKAYVASARRIWAARHGEELGIIIPEGVKADLKRIKQRKDALVQESVDKIKSGVEKEENITFFRGEAKFTGERTLNLNGDELKANEIFINVGSRPAVPDSFKKLNYLTNESILQLEEVPGHLVIIGGSYNGLEFGQIFRRFGSRVTIVEKEGRIAQHEDDVISESILDFLKEEGIDFRLDANCIGGRQNDDGTVTVQLECKQGEPEITGTHLLLAVGRTPNSDTLNLDACGVKTDDKGYIQVNDNLETNVKGIYALGECNGMGAFTHTSFNDFEIVSDNLLKGKNRKVSDRIMTYALYTDPPLGRAGMTKKAARSKKLKILEAKMPMSSVSRAKEKGETKGLLHVIADAGTRKILGAAILGIGGDEIISSILHVMYAGVTWDVIINAVKPHPTVSELLPSLLKKLKEAE
jgi:pyruvate/2-oxoglutarate dehydrogenase complex dihydrolipoamide dehydrogenase (E3) component